MKWFFVFTAVFSSVAPLAASAEERSLYEILGVPESASQEAIRDTYLRLRSDTHPDKSGSGTTAMQFDETQKAFDIIGDPHKREIYDQQRRERMAPSSSSYGSAPGPLKQAARMAEEQLDQLHSTDRYREGFRDPHYNGRKRDIDKMLRRQVENLLNGDLRGRPVIIPEEALHFPQTLSLLAARGADLTSAPPGERLSPLEAALKMRESESFEALISHAPFFINTKTKKGTPLFNLILEKIEYTRREAERHYNRPSCPPSCYGSWKKSEKGWKILANKILVAGVVDLTLRDARGDFSLVTALKFDLDIAQKIESLYKKKHGPLAKEDQSRLRKIAREMKVPSLERRFRDEDAEAEKRAGAKREEAFYAYLDKLPQDPSSYLEASHRALTLNLPEAAERLILQTDWLKRLEEDQKQDLFAAAVSKDFETAELVFDRGGMTHLTIGNQQRLINKWREEKALKMPAWKSGMAVCVGLPCAGLAGVAPALLFEMPWGADILFGFLSATLTMGAFASELSGDVLGACYEAFKDSRLEKKYRLVPDGKGSPRAKAKTGAMRVRQ